MCIFLKVISCNSNHFWSITRVSIESLGSFRLETQNFISKSLVEPKIFKVQSFITQGCGRIRLYTIFWDETYRVHRECMKGCAEGCMKAAWKMHWGICRGVHGELAEGCMESVWRIAWRFAQTIHGKCLESVQGECMERSTESTQRGVWRMYGGLHRVCVEDTWGTKGIG